MTSREFAKMLGVSQSTISRALNGSTLVPDEKRHFIQQKAREVGFILNSQAKSLRTQKTGTIGILFPKHFISMSANRMLAHLYDCIQQEMHKYNYDVMTVYSSAVNNDFSSFERIVRARKVDGFLVMRMEISKEELELVKSDRVPCIFMMNAGDKIYNSLNYLFSDSEYGGYLAGRYFGKFPKYRKLFITVYEEKRDARRRREGFERGLSEFDCQLADEDILYCNLGVDSAYQCIMKNKQLIKSGKVAIFSYSDTLAIGVLNACLDLGCRVPEDVQLISMDDIPCVAEIHPSLSTLHIPVEEMVSESCSLLVDLIDGKKRKRVQKWLHPNLVLRDTTINIES